MVTHQNGLSVPAAYPSDSDLHVFARFAGDNLDTWKEIVGCIIEHHMRGKGVVQSVRSAASGIVVLVIHPQEPTVVREYATWILLNRVIFRSLVFPAHLASTLEALRSQMRYGEGSQRSKLEFEHRGRLEAQQQRERLDAELSEKRRAEAEQRRLREQAAAEQRRREEQAAADFANLKAKYDLDGYKDSSPMSPLFAILLKLDSRELVLEDDRDWLKQERLFAVLAACSYANFVTTGDGWNVAAASSYWRQADLPERALDATESYLNANQRNNRRLLGAIYTTRGGAFRDLEDFPAAENSAFDAIRHEPHSYYPFNLLGAVYFQQGLPEKGLESFSRAQELGAPPFMEEQEMRGALNRSGKEERKAVAKYLLMKNPQRYHWATAYLA